jgi:hypothetical protein
MLLIGGGLSLLDAYQNRDRPGRNRLAQVDAGTRRRHTLNILLWVLQVLAALLYGASGVMKVFMLDNGPRLRS